MLFGFVAKYEVKTLNTSYANGTLLVTVDHNSFDIERNASLLSYASSIYNGIFNQMRVVLKKGIDLIVKTIDTKIFP